MTSFSFSAEYRTSS